MSASPVTSKVHARSILSLRYAVLAGMAVATLAIPAGGAAETVPSLVSTRLRTVSEWNQICANYGAGSARKAALCKIKVNRPIVNGRSLGPFDLIDPADSSLLQSRSGVLFRADLNKELVALEEDTGARMRVRLHSDVNCQAYATALTTVGLPRNARDMTWMIESWLQVYTDARSEIRDRRLRERDGGRILEFVAVTDDQREIRGTYAANVAMNSAIFSTCDHPKASPRAQETAEHFFNSISGTVRKYL